MAITTAAQAAAIMNQSLSELGYSYQIDTTNNETIEQGFKAIGAYPESQKNAILKQVNTILVFRNYFTMFDESKNPTRRFWREDTEYGGGIEDLYHEIIEPVEGFWAEEFAKDSVNDDELALNIAKDLVKYHGSKIKHKFHTEEDAFTIPLSITEMEAKKAFTPSGFVSYIDVKMANLQASAEVKLQNIAIEAIKQMVTDGNLVYQGGFNLNHPNGVTDAVEYVQTTSDEMTNLSNEFNNEGVLNISNFDDVFLVTTSEFINRLRVRGYANAYNLKEYAIKNRLMVLPKGSDFGTIDGKKVHAILLDRRAIVMSLRYWKMKPFIVSNTDYENYFLKVRVIKGYNEFFNAVAIVGDDIGAFNDNTAPSTVTFGSAITGNVFVNGLKVNSGAALQGQVFTIHVGDIVEIDTAQDVRIYGGYTSNISNMVEVTSDDGTFVANYPIMIVQ